MLPHNYIVALADQIAGPEHAAAIQRERAAAERVAALIGPRPPGL